MTPSPSTRSRSRLFALTAIAFLAFGVAIAFRQWRAMPAGSGLPAGPPGDGVAVVEDADSDGVIGQALEAALDSSAIKSRWVEDIPEIDLSGLDPGRREIFVRFANSQRCTCGCGYTLAGCRLSDMSCDVSAPKLMALLDSVRTGRLRNPLGARRRPRRPRLTVRANGR